MGLLKSLAKSTGSSFMDKFRKTDPLPEFPQPLGFRIGAVVTLDSLDFRLLASKLKMNFPGNTHIIVAYGRIDMDSRTTIHRFYTKDEVIFQLSTEGSNDNVTEIKLLVPHDIVYPGSHEEWAAWVDPINGMIGSVGFELQDGTEFTRAWFEDTDNHVQPVEFNETVVVNEKGDTYLIEHKAMMYARWMDDNEENVEWLLISAEDTGETAHIELNLGMDFSESSFEVV